MMWVRELLRLTLRLLTLLLLAGLAGAVLARYSPGFGTNEEELDSRLSKESVQAIRASHREQQNIFAYFTHYLARVAHGDFGSSNTFKRPVSELFLQRLPRSARSVGLGLLAGWALALALALPAGLANRHKYDLFATALSGLFLSLPSVVIALFFLYYGGAPSWAVGLIIFPRIFRLTRNLVTKTFAMPHILSAKSRGLRESQVLVWHVLPVMAPQMLALAGVSISMAVGAAIPVEVICDSPGIGQLAWQAALGRDLPLLINITVLVASITLFANSISDLASWSLSRRAA